MKKKLDLQVTLTDIGRARCANRRRCVLAQALDRQLGLGGKGYIRVDANGAGYTRDKERHLYHLPNTAVSYLRRFDEIGEAKGEMEARRAIRPRKFVLDFIKTTPIPPVASRKRKDQINARRNAVRAEEKGKGILPKTYRRYVGTSPIA
jgi:hypothetical protein